MGAAPHFNPPVCVCLPTEHSNYFGTDEKLGVVAVSVRREKLDDTKELKDQYQYRLIIRTSEVPAAPSHHDGGGVTTRLDLTLIPYRLRPRPALFFASSPPSPVILGLTSPPLPAPPKPAPASGKFHLPILSSQKPNQIVWPLRSRCLAGARRAVHPAVSPSTLTDYGLCHV